MKQTAKVKKDSKKTLRLVKRFIPVYLMALPGVIYLFINNYMPLPGLVLAFKKYSTKKGIWGSPWVGLKNFKYLFRTQDAWIITRNTLGYNILFIIVNVIMAVSIAIILSELTTRWKKVYQSTILLPHFLSTVIISYLVFAFLSSENGFLNNSIFPLFGKEPIPWYTEPNIGLLYWYSYRPGEAWAITVSCICPRSWDSTGKSMRHLPLTVHRNGSRSERSLCRF